MKRLWHILSELALRSKDPKLIPYFFIVAWMKITANKYWGDSTVAILILFTPSATGRKLVRINMKMDQATYFAFQEENPLEVAKDLKMGCKFTF